MTLRIEQYQEIIHHEKKICTTDLEKILAYIEERNFQPEEGEEKKYDGLECENTRQCFWNMYQNSEDQVHALYLKEAQRLKAKAEAHVELALRIFKKDSSSGSVPLCNIQRFDKISSYDNFIQENRELQKDIDNLQDFLRMSHLSLSKILSEYETVTGCDAKIEAPSHFRDCKLCPRKNSLLWLKNQTIEMNEKIFQRKKELMCSEKRKKSLKHTLISSPSVELIKTSFRKTRPLLRRLWFKKKGRKTDKPDTRKKGLETCDRCSIFLK